MSNLTTPESVNLQDYWQASARAQEILASVTNPDRITDRNRIDYYDAMRVVEDAQRRARAGAKTGRTILDNLMASGQLMTPQRLEELAGIEAKLVTNEPVLLQQGFKWRLGVLAYDKLFFSGVDRRSYFGPIANGYQALPVRSYVEMQLEPMAVYRPEIQGYKKFGAKSMEPNDIPPEAGNIGLPLTPVYSFNLPMTHDAPQGLLAAWTSYSETMGRPTEHGGRTFTDALLVGRGVVETGLGISLDDVLGCVDNKALRAYVDQPTTPSA